MKRVCEETTAATKKNAHIDKYRDREREKAHALVKENRHTQRENHRPCGVKVHDNSARMAI